MMIKRALPLLLLLTLIPTARVFAADGKVTKSYFLGFGPGYFSNMNSRSMTTVFSPGLVWGIDPQFDLYTTLDIGYSFKHTDMRYFVAHVKGRYIFSEESNHSWYAGGGLGLGYAVNHGGGGRGHVSVKGFTLNAALGYKFYRKTAMPLTIEIEHQMMLEESVNGTPLLTSLKFGVFFPPGFF